MMTYLSVMLRFVIPGLCFAASADAVSVKDFGAMGDGQADDTAAIVAAVAGATNGIVEVPRGQHRITRTIEVQLERTGKLGLAGHGGSATLVMAGPGPALRLIGTHAKGSANPETVEPRVWSHQRAPVIESLEIRGDHPEADGIEVRDAMQPIVRGVLIRQVRHGLHFTSRSRNVLVADCHIYDCSGYGIFLDEVNIHQINISDSHISYCRRGGIMVAASEIRNIQITGNDIEYNCDPNGPPAADIWFDSSRRSSVREGTISANNIQAILSPGGANIRLTGAPPTSDKVGLLAIAGNHISSQEVNIHLESARGVTISGNTFTRGFEQNVRIEGSRNVAVNGNVFDRNPDYFRGPPLAKGGISIDRSDVVILSDNIMDGAESGSETAGGAIAITASQLVTLSNCQITDPKFRGIHVDGSTNVRVTDCTVSEAVAPRMLAAIEITGESPGAFLRDNSLSRGKHGDVVARAGNAAVEGTRPVAPVRR